MKKVLKKIISLVVAVSMMIIPASSAFASNLQNESISKETVYYSTGTKNIMIQKTDSSVNVYEDELISKYVDESGKEIQSRCSNSTAYIPLSGDIDDVFDEITRLVSRAGGSNYVYSSDTYGCAQFNTTVSYNKTTVSGADYYKITSITGGFYDAGTTGSYVGENVYVTSHYINVSQCGTPISGTPTSISQTDSASFSNSNRSWSYTPPSSWVAIEDLAAYAIVGAQYYFTLARGASSWTSHLNNAILLNGATW